MSYTNGLDNPELYMQVKLYTGNATDDTGITLDGDEDMQPDLVWFKDRDNANHHQIFDAVRGATKKTYSSLTSAEGTDAASLQSFDSDGFTVGTSSDVNGNTATFVAWCWKESAVSGMDIVSYVGNATGRTISHSLSAVPHCMIIFNRDSATNRHVYHHKNTSAPETDYLKINSTDGTADAASVFNDTAPTSSVFSVGTGDGTNKNTDNIIAYLFSEKQAFSKFGSYTGNGNADGTFIYTGFRPAMIIFKQTNAGGEKWYMFDSKRNPFNLTNELLMANVGDAESVNTTGAPIDILSNGFKIRGTDAAGNASGATYIYMAFAEAPFVNSNGVPCNAR